MSQCPACFPADAARHFPVWEILPSACWICFSVFNKWPWTWIFTWPDGRCNALLWITCSCSGWCWINEANFRFCCKEDDTDQFRSSFSSERSSQIINIMRLLVCSFTKPWIYSSKNTRTESSENLWSGITVQCLWSKSVFWMLMWFISHHACVSGLWGAVMTKSYEFNWQKRVPEFLQEGAAFDRFDEVNALILSHTSCFCISRVSQSSSSISWNDVQDINIQRCSSEGFWGFFHVDSGIRFVILS